MSENELKKGSLIFLKSTLVDLFYIVKRVEGEEVVARKLDAPPNNWERLPLDRVVRLAEEQERILPYNLSMAIEEQRKVVFAPPKTKKKKESLDRMMKRLPKEGIEEILAVLAAAGVEDDEEEQEG